MHHPDSSLIHSLPLNSPLIPDIPLSSPLLPSVLPLTQVFGCMGFLDSSCGHAAPFPPYSGQLILDSLLLIQTVHFEVPIAGTQTTLQLPAEVTLAVPDSLLLWWASDFCEITKINCKTNRRFILRIVLYNIWDYLFYINVRKDFAIYLSVCTFL